MNRIQIEHNPRKEKLEDLSVFSWPTWEKEVSEFFWKYKRRETCYIIDGEAEIKSDNGEKMTIEKGDLVIFQQGLDCTWKIIKPIKKYYKFS